MPELPEVETVRVGLAPILDGRLITGVSVLHPRPIRGQDGGADVFVHRLVGRTIATPLRRGKYLWWPLDRGDALLAHLGMSGQFRVDDPAAPLQRHARVCIDLSGGGQDPRTTPHVTQVRFVDQRMFGGLQVSFGGAGLPPEIAHIARDLFDPELDRTALVGRIQRSSSRIKALLLNQSVVSGIGNIYADEALWRARVHGETRGEALSARKVHALLTAAFDTMTEALAQGGTSFDTLYVNVNGESGYFSRRLNVYGREGEACLRCQTPIRRVAFANRSSHFCPRCQRRG